MKNPWRKIIQQDSLRKLAIELGLLPPRRRRLLQLPYSLVKRRLLEGLAKDVKYESHRDEESSSPMRKTNVSLPCSRLVHPFGKAIKVKKSPHSLSARFGLREWHRGAPATEPINNFRKRLAYLHSLDKLEKLNMNRLNTVFNFHQLDSTRLHEFIWSWGRMLI